jgi:8-oxo-dGTP diphosphatase
MRTIFRPIVSGLIFSRDGKLLLGKKDPKKGGVYADLWHLPGGGVDQDEDLLTALKREIQEEVGIDISPYQISLVDDLGTGSTEKILKDTGEKVLCDMKFNVYKIDIVDKNATDISVKLNDDLIQYLWATNEELGKMPLVPASVSLFKRLGILK